MIAHLCEKYPIVKTYNVAKLAINVAFTILQSNLFEEVFLKKINFTLIFDKLKKKAQTFDERRKFCAQIMPAIITFYTKLPPLTQECMSLFTNAIQTKSIVGLKIY